MMLRKDFTAVEFRDGDALRNFLRANGLRPDLDQEVSLIRTPDDHIVGVAVLGAAVGAVGAVAFLAGEQYTAPDGTEVAAWWPTARPAWTLIPLDENLQEDTEAVEVGPTLGPDEVVCDICNDLILIRPVPLVDGHALCRRCFSRTGLRFPSGVAPYVPEALAEKEAE